MALQYVTTGGTLIIPSAVASIKVEQNDSRLATNGVLLLIGEADAGPDYSLEDDLSENSFSPDQLAEVVSKYKSGNLVEAFLAATAAANDPNIEGSFSRAILVKTNVSAKADIDLLDHASATYTTLQDKSYGKLGNLIYRTVDEDVAEVVPTTGPFTFLIPVDTFQFDMDFRVNGGAEVSVNNFTSAGTPTTFVAAVAGLAGVLATGGALRTVLPGVAGTLALTVIAGNNVQIDYSGTFTTTPSVGDTLYIPTGSPIENAVNDGSYVVTAATDDQILATKLLDATGATPDSLTAPSTIGAQAVGATTDIRVYSPVTISLEAGDPIHGKGKSLEIIDDAGDTSLFSYHAYALSATPVTWISDGSTANIIVSSAEYKVGLHLNRQLDAISEDLSVGGEVAFKIGYEGTTATITTTATTLTTSVAGGSGANLSITLADFPTISDLATYINAQTGYTCAVGTAVLGQLPPTALDYITTQGICSTNGGTPGRLKIDAYRFFNKVNDESVLAEIEERPTAGLPVDTSTVAYFSGGDKGGTTDAIVTAACLALDWVDGNFVVPCFSRNATDDITDSLTESSSTYTIAGIHGAVKSHVLRVSTLKRKRNRQAFLSVLDDFVTCKETAANIASYRCSMTFQDVKATSLASGIVQQQPWMGAVYAASMQAAAFYRSIMKKFMNCSGVVMETGDFNHQNTGDLEEALLAGLLPIERAKTGGFRWVSDQTTYGKDSNFVYNSNQAVYAADVVALTCAERMESAFVGQNISDAGANVMKAFLESVLREMRRLKLIVASDDAPAGYKDASVKISGNAAIVSVSIKLNGVIAFIPISFLVQQVEQSA